MLDLYIANKNYSSWSLRPWVLMKQLDIPFNEHLMPFEGGIGANWDTFRRFSPSGLVPCLVDDGIVVWDSLAIAEYLAEHHEGVWPSDAKARAWARSASAEMHSGFASLRNECSMNCGLRVELHSVSAGLRHDLKRLEELWQQGLERFGGPFLAGSHFSAVDAFYAPVAFRIQSFGLPLGERSQVYVERLLALPAMQAWYQAALAEPWREAGHERESLANAVLLKDLRTG